MAILVCFPHGTHKLLWQVKVSTLYIKFRVNFFKFRNVISLFGSFLSRPAGAAGFFVSFIRIITKLMLNDQQENTLIFFLVSIAMVGLCFGLHHTIRKTAFIKYYIMLCQERKITLEPTEDAGLVSMT